MIFSETSGLPITIRSVHYIHSAPVDLFFAMRPALLHRLILGAFPYVISLGPGKLPLIYESILRAGFWHVMTSQNYIRKCCRNRSM